VRLFITVDLPVIVSVFDELLEPTMFIGEYGTS
jgi:hypothetical protein